MTIKELNFVNRKFRKYGFSVPFCHREVEGVSSDLCHELSISISDKITGNWRFYDCLASLRRYFDAHSIVVMIHSNEVVIY